MKIQIDFSRRTGRRIRPLHGINNSRVSLYKPMPELAEAGIPFVRLHDFGGAFGGHVYVDVPNLFPDFEADENNPESYRFEFTDAYFKQLTASGPQIFFRLGVTIENNYKLHAYRVNPPKDFAKWARICEHIVRHYNEGWNNGFHYNITYWEIWNEPENAPMWTGTKQEFFQFYKTASLHLRKCFPDIKIGGYASCGFYEVSIPNCNDFFKTFIPWFTDFVKFVKEENLPFDFFSWHRYLQNPKCLIAEAAYARKILDENGFTKTESIFDEWNFCDGTPDQWDHMKSHIGASAVAETLIVLQKETSVDKAMYYDAMPTRAYCGLYYYPSQKVTPTYYAFKAFNALYQKGEEVPVKVTGRGAAVLAAAKGDSCAMLIANSGKRKAELVMEFQNVPGNPQVLLIDATHTFEKIRFAKKMILPPQSVLLAEWNGTSMKKSDVSAGNGKFAGLG